MYTVRIPNELFIHYPLISVENPTGYDSIKSQISEMMTSILSFQEEPLNSKINPDDNCKGKTDSGYRAGAIEERRRCYEGLTE